MDFVRLNGVVMHFLDQGPQDAPVLLDRLVIRDAGHLPSIEQPAATAAAIEGFVEENRLVG